MSGFSDDDWNGLSDEENTFDPNPTFLGGPLMAQQQNFSHHNCELLTYIFFSLNFHLIKKCLVSATLLVILIYHRPLM